MLFSDADQRHMAQALALAEREAGLRQHDLARLAHEEQAAPLALEHADLVGDGGLADAEFLRRLLEALQPRRRLEGPQRGEGQAPTVAWILHGRAVGAMDKARFIYSRSIFGLSMRPRAPSLGA